MKEEETFEEEEIRSRGGECGKHSTQIYIIMVVKTQRMKSGWAVLYIKFRTKSLEIKGYVLLT